MDPDLAVADDVESNVLTPAKGVVPTESRPPTLVKEEEKGLGKPFSK